MSRNGSGTYSLPAGNPVVTGTTISSTWANNTMTDIASALTDSVAADGQTPMTGNLNMSNNKIVNVTNPTLAQDAATKTYVDAKTDGTSAGAFTTLSATGNVSFDGGTFFVDSATNNVGIGTSSPTTKLNVAGLVRSTSGANSVDIGHDGTNGSITSTNSLLQYATGSNPIVFHTNGSERVRINSVGDLLVGTNAGSGKVVSDVGSTAGGVCFRANGGSVNSEGGQIGMFNSYAGVPNPSKTLRINNSGQFEFVNSGYTSAIFQLFDNGSAYNTTGTWGTISDERMKDNIQDARNYLPDICRLRVVKYSLKSEKSEVPTKLGFVAQEVEQVFPNMVESSKDSFSGLDDLKQVKLSVLTPMLVKAIQEQQAIINDLKARIETLEAK